MSGVEVAGFILGAFPLLISALEDYRQGWEILEDWWKIKSEYKKCQQNLKLQKLVFEENLEQLLSTLVHDDDELKQLIASPGEKLWQDPELEEGLRERLPRSYEVYLEIIGEILTVIESLKKEIGVDVPAFQGRIEETVSVSGSLKGYSSSVQIRVKVKPNLEYQMQRVKFTFNKKPRNKLMEELASYNSRLRELLDSSDRLAATRQRRKKSTPLAGAKMSNFWQHAKSIYDALKKAWCCDCSSLHQANLLLECRSTPEVELKVDFVFSEDFEHDVNPWSYRRTTIKQIDRPSQTSFTVPDIVTTSPPPYKPIQNSALRPSMKFSPSMSKKGVKWQSSSLIESQCLNDINSEPESIRDICSAFTTTHATSSAFGCLMGNDCQYSMCPFMGHESEHADFKGVVSLESLLSKTSPLRLTRRQRYYIALTLASSHLQLHDSPWLGSQWKKKDILFYGSGGKTIDDRPYMSRSFHSNPSHKPSYYEVADHGMSTLGILLLELCFGTALEDHEIRRTFPTLDGAANSALDLVAAMQWCDRYANDEAGPEFAEAIKWCLRNPTIRGGSEKEQGWREELWTQVVEPLQYCHRQLSAGAGS